MGTEYRSILDTLEPHHSRADVRIILALVKTALNSSDLADLKRDVAALDL